MWSQTSKSQRKHCCPHGRTSPAFQAGRVQNEVKDRPCCVLVFEAHEALIVLLLLNTRTVAADGSLLPLPVQKLIASNKLPHLLFYGPPGTGKTSTILACAKKLYGPDFKMMVLEVGEICGDRFDWVAEPASETIVSNVTASVRVLSASVSCAVWRHPITAMLRSLPTRYVLALQMSLSPLLYAPPRDSST